MCTETSYCDRCVHGETFAKRPDERFSAGCRLPGFEGYEDPTKPSCHGKDFRAKQAA